MQARKPRSQRMEPRRRGFCRNWRKRGKERRRRSKRIRPYEERASEREIDKAVAIWFVYFVFDVYALFLLCMYLCYFHCVYPMLFILVALPQSSRPWRQYFSFHRSKRRLKSCREMIGGARVLFFSPSSATEEKTRDRICVPVSVRWNKWKKRIYSVRKREKISGYR